MISMPFAPTIVHESKWIWDLKIEKLFYMEVQEDYILQPKVKFKNMQPNNTLTI